MDYETILLDIDGTLIDSNQAHAQAWADALATHGIQVPIGRVRRLIGMGGDKILREVAGIDAKSAIGRAISSTRRQAFATRSLPQLRPTRGARDLILWLKQHGFRIVIATSAQSDEVDGLLRAAQVNDLIDDATSSDDAPRSKPDADIVAAALERAGTKPDAAIMIGDTPYDIEAASRAGVITIALRCGGWADEDLRGAAAIFDDPADLLTNIERSPLHRQRSQLQGR